MTKSQQSASHNNAADRALVAGFVNPALEQGHVVTKVLASNLTARMVAVSAWVTTGERISHKILADRIGMSGRWLSYQFPDQNALYAFPPPQLACALTSAAKDPMLSLDRESFTWGEMGSGSWSAAQQCSDPTDHP